MYKYRLAYMYKGCTIKNKNNCVLRTSLRCPKTASSCKKLLVVAFVSEAPLDQWAIHVNGHFVVLTGWYLYRTGSWRREIQWYYTAAALSRPSSSSQLSHSHSTCTLYIHPFAHRAHHIIYHMLWVVIHW